MNIYGSPDPENGMVMYMDTDILFNNDEKLLRARDLIDDWENLRARRLLEEVLEEEPLCEDAHYLMGLLYEIRYLKLDAALNCYETAYRIDPGHMENRLAYMKMLNRSGMSVKALEVYDAQAVEGSAYSELIHIQAAIAFEKSGRLVQALNIIDRLRRECTRQSQWEILGDIRDRLLIKAADDKKSFSWG